MGQWVLVKTIPQQDPINPFTRQEHGRDQPMVGEIEELGEQSPQSR